MPGGLPTASNIFKDEFLGQIIHIRSTSKKVVWLYTESMTSKERISVLGCDSTDPLLLAFLKYTVKLGDIVRFKGTMDRAPLKELFRPAKCEMITKYFGSPFTAITPPPKKDIPVELACKSWINSGSCPNGIACKFQHPVGEQLKTARQEYMAAKVEKKKTVNMDLNDPHLQKSSHGSRSSVFADWIWATFGSQLLKGRVLDVAGGRGLVSMTLSLLYGVKTLLVDPRSDTLRPNRQVYKLLSNTTNKIECTHIQDHFNGTFASRWPLECLSFVFGMHPDQPTEDIVDYAIQHKLPFAIVPCCVFGRENLHRKTAYGEPVVTYDQFIEYLMRKHYSIEKGYLGFQGKNMVLYSLGTAYSVPTGTS